MQVAGKLPVNFRGLGVDAMTVSAHKFHGPCGIGALLLRPHVVLQPQMVRRIPTTGIATRNGVGAVGRRHARGSAVCGTRAGSNIGRMTALRDRLESGHPGGVPGSHRAWQLGLALASHDERLLSGSESAGPADGVGPGGRGLFQRFCVCQRLHRSFAHCSSPWAAPRSCWHSSIRLSLGTCNHGCRSGRSRPPHPPCLQRFANHKTGPEFGRDGSHFRVKSGRLLA